MEVDDFDFGSEAGDPVWIMKLGISRWNGEPS
jgi:hypothetical protein